MGRQVLHVLPHMWNLKKINWKLKQLFLSTRKYAESRGVVWKKDDGVRLMLYACMEIYQTLLIYTIKMC
jgi:hypothetical protein